MSGVFLFGTPGWRASRRLIRLVCFFTILAACSGRHGSGVIPSTERHPSFTGSASGSGDCNPSAQMCFGTQCAEGTDPDPFDGSCPDPFTGGGGGGGGGLVPPPAAPCDRRAVAASKREVQSRRGPDASKVQTLMARIAANTIPDSMVESNIDPEVQGAQREYVRRRMLELARSARKHIAGFDEADTFSRTKHQTTPIWLNKCRGRTWVPMFGGIRAARRSRYQVR